MTTQSATSLGNASRVWTALHEFVARPDCSGQRRVNVGDRVIDFRLINEVKVTHQLTEREKKCL
jgi:hypothetical protein